MTGQPITLAVLPFVSLSPGQDYFSDGLTDGVLQALGRVPRFRVTSRTSSFAFKGKNIDLREVGRRLEVRYVLEGSVRKAGDRVRVSVQLIDTRNGYQEWGETIDRQADHIFDLQDAIGERIAERLKARLATQVVLSAQASTTTYNLEAWHLYLKGRYAWNERTTDSVREAIRFYQQALDIDPRIVQAWSGLASGYVFLGAYGQLPREEAFPKGTQAAERSLALDPRSEESHLAIAQVRLFYDLDWNEAGRSFRRALQLNPGLADIYPLYSDYLQAIGSFDLAIDYLEMAVKLNPLSTSVNCQLANGYLKADRLAEALEQLERTLELDPEYRPAWETKAFVLGAMGRLNDSLEAWKYLRKLVNHPLRGVTGWGYGHALIGNREKALEALAIMDRREQAEPDVNLTTDRGMIYLGLGDTDRCLDCMIKGFHGRMGVFSIVTHPLWEGIRKKPRMKALVDTIKRDDLVPNWSLTTGDEDNNLVVLQSETKESVAFDPRDLLYAEAQGNYTQLVWIDRSEVRQQLLRLLIGKVEQVLAPFQVVRCHRSFVVNLEQVRHVTGNARGYKLHFAHDAEPVPVSRSLAPELLSRLQPTSV